MINWYFNNTDSFVKYFANIFSHSWDCIFIFLMVSFDEQKFVVVVFTKVNLSIFSFYFNDFSVLRNLCLPPNSALMFLLMFSSRTCSFMFSYRNFIILPFEFKPVVYVKLTFIHVRYGSIYFFFPCEWKVLLILLTHRDGKVTLSRWAATCNACKAMLIYSKKDTI